MFVFSGEMPVPEEHHGKGVPGVLNLNVRPVEFPGDLITGGLLLFYLPPNFCATIEV